MLVDKFGNSYFIETKKDVESLLHELIGGNIQFYYDTIMNMNKCDKYIKELEDENDELNYELGHLQGDYDDLESVQYRQEELLKELLEEISDEDIKERIDEVLI